MHSVAWESKPRIFDFFLNLTGEIKTDKFCLERPTLMKFRSGLYLVTSKCTDVAISNKTAYLGTCKTTCMQ